jgi:hypothetical protein
MHATELFEHPLPQAPPQRVADRERSDEHGRADGDAQQHREVAAAMVNEVSAE